MNFIVVKTYLHDSVPLVLSLLHAYSGIEKSLGPFLEKKKKKERGRDY